MRRCSSLSFASASTARRTSARSLSSRVTMASSFETSSLSLLSVAPHLTQHSRTLCTSFVNTPPPPSHEQTVFTETPKQEEDPENAIKDVQQKILESALKSVPHYGWTTEALSQGALEAGYSGIATGLFPRGPAELVEFWLNRVDEQMKEKVKAMDMSSMNMKEKIKAVMRTRLELFIPYMGTWQQALGILAHPTNLQYSMQRLYNVVNDMWYLIGDKSTDFDWYTKRALVTAAYTATELYMLTDGSQNYEQTWEFLDRRIDDIATLSKYKTEVQDFCNLAGGIANTFVSNACRTAPINPFSSMGSTTSAPGSQQTATGAAADTIFKASETANTVFSAATAAAGSVMSPNFTNMASSLISTAVNVLSNLGQQQMPTSPPPPSPSEEMTAYEDEFAMHATPAPHPSAATTAPTTTSTTTATTAPPSSFGAATTTIPNMAASFTASPPPPEGIPTGVSTPL